MVLDFSISLPKKLAWNRIYTESELLRSALALYTKPVFSPSKSHIRSTDEKDFFDFAKQGPTRLRRIHESLRSGQFRFRPALAKQFKFNGRHRTFYILPWEERIVDALLFSLLSKNLEAHFSDRSFAYRRGLFGLDRCQRLIATALRTPGPKYIFKRDIAEFFPSISHAILLQQITQLIEPRDFLRELLIQRIQFTYQLDGNLLTAERGIPLGGAVSGVLANLHLSPWDKILEQIPGIHYFRYADDFLMITRSREAIATCRSQFQNLLEEFQLKSKAKHEKEITLASERDSFKHLGLEYNGLGQISLSRDKLRKIQNLFRYSLRRKSLKLKRVRDPKKRATAAIECAKQIPEISARNVSLIDYYLRHTSDESQLRLLDRWLAEEVLAFAFQNGHKKGNFQKLPFETLRQMGLPSLVHRRRLIHNNHIESPFFIWKNRRRLGPGIKAARFEANLSLDPESSAP